MANKIKPKRSYTASSVPLTSDLDTHELAINWVDGKAFTKNAAGNIVSVTLGGGGGSGSVVTAASVSAFPATGSASNLYITTEDQRIWRWDSTAGIYVESGPIGGGSDGTDTVLRALFVPGAPTSVTASAGNAQASVSWTAPTGVITQAPITDYFVQFSSNSGSSWTTFSDGTATATSATVTGLTNGTAYTFRVAAVNGVGTGAYSTASSAVTPETDSEFSSVSLLLHMDGTGSTFVDSSGTPKTITANGNATQTTDQSQFGGKSAVFDGSGDWINTNTSDGLTFGTGDFTIEFWARPTGSQPSNPRIIGNLSANAFSTGDWVLTQNLNCGFYAYNYQSGGSPIVSLGSSLTNDTWAHVAIVRSGSSWSMYKDGARVSTNTWSGSLDNGTRRLVVGSSGNTGEAWTGYIDELRVTKVARYAGSTITVRTAAFPGL